MDCLVIDEHEHGVQYCILLALWLHNVHLFKLQALPKVNTFFFGALNSFNQREVGERMD